MGEAEGGAEELAEGGQGVPGSPGRRRREREENREGEGRTERERRTGNRVRDGRRAMQLRTDTMSDQGGNASLMQNAHYARPSKRSFSKTPSSG